MSGKKNAPHTAGEDTWEINDERTWRDSTGDDREPPMGETDNLYLQARQPGFQCNTFGLRSARPRVPLIQCISFWPSFSLPPSRIGQLGGCPRLVCCRRGAWDSRWPPPPRQMRADGTKANPPGWAVGPDRPWRPDGSRIRT